MINPFNIKKNAYYALPMCDTYLKVNVIDFGWFDDKNCFKPWVLFYFYTVNAKIIAQKMNRFKFALDAKSL